MTPNRINPLAFYVMFLLGILVTGGAAYAAQRSTGDTYGVEVQPPTAGGPNECGLLWRVVPSPNGGIGNELLDVEVVAENDVWAVGFYYETVTGGQAIRASIQHWNGSAWSLVSAPQPGTASYLGGVSAVSPSDIWAVGYYFASEQMNTLTLHWDGSVWSQVTSPNFGASSALLEVWAVASDSVWAVGSKTGGTLVLFWDGTSWSSIPSPGVGPYDRLSSVTALTVDDMWAVGNTRPTGGSNQTLTVHCSRSGCVEVDSPNVGAGRNDLAAVSALAPDNVWTVGYTDIVTNPQSTVPMAMKWDGVGWAVLPMPPTPPGWTHVSFVGLVAFSDNDVWAVGLTYNSQSRQGQTLIEHWNGSSWTIVTSPNLGVTNYFSGVDALATDYLWAVGGYTPSAGALVRTLVERYHEPCSEPTPEPSVEPSVEPTETPTEGPSPTPGSCTIEFSDVTPDSTFYRFVRCLACLAIINGYPDGTFRPGNNVTRGQLAKIVSNAAGFGEPHSEQSFEDVAPGSTFHEYVERLASRGMIGGYACGNPEPCVPPNNLPYYRPNANVTRGQSAKIVASAALLPAPPSGQQSFEDVPEGSTFWEWIEALSSTGAIAGYPCGNANPNPEPCVPPDNRPYFRSANNVTRGQSSKIVANTFFPACGIP